MARKIHYHRVEAEGRDKGKTFVLTEMSSDQAERWAIRFLLALSAGGHEIPDELAETGMAGVAAVMSGAPQSNEAQRGLGAMITWAVKAISGLSWKDASPLLDEMMSCVTIQPDPAVPAFTRALIPDDVEEIATRFQIRREVFKLHLSFSLGVGPLNSAVPGTAPQSTA